MLKQTNSKRSTILSNLIRGSFSLAFLFLLIEFFDELNYGVEGAALPAIRTDLGLSYAQVGLLLGLPAIIVALIGVHVYLVIRIGITAVPKDGD